MDIILSIVVPIYKTEKYLSNCIESIINQQFKSYELILVDDGSPDNSKIIYEEYAKKYSQIKVIFKTNGGLSSARNAGIEIATGKYITFIDSDDMIAPDTYINNMNTLLENPDIDMLEFPVYIYYKSKHGYIKKDISENIIGKNNILIKWMQKEGYKYCYAWNKIYKKKLFEHIRFPEGKNFEDVYTLPLILELCNHIYVSEQGLYYYYYRAQSITQKANSEDCYNLFISNIMIQQKIKRYLPFLHKELFIHNLYINNILISYLRKTKNKIDIDILINQIDKCTVSLLEYLKLKIPLRSKIKNITLVFLNPQIHYFCYVTMYKLLFRLRIKL